MLRKQWHGPVVLALAAAALLLCFRNLCSPGGGREARPSPSVLNGTGSSTTPSRTRRLFRSGRGVPLIAGQLAPGLKIEAGTVAGASIRGPVRVTGSLPPSSMTPLRTSSDTNEETFKIEASESGIVMGSFAIQAAGAQATQGGVRFTGPLRLRYQGDVGQWYELGSVSGESYFFVSKDGRKKLLAIPAGTQSVTPGPPESE